MRYGQNKVKLFLLLNKFVAKKYSIQNIQRFGLGPHTMMRISEHSHALYTWFSIPFFIYLFVTSNLCLLVTWGGLEILANKLNTEMRKKWICINLARLEQPLATLIVVFPALVWVRALSQFISVGAWCLNGRKSLQPLGRQKLSSGGSYWSK